MQTLSPRSFEDISRTLIYYTRHCEGDRLRELRLWKNFHGYMDLRRLHAEVKGLRQHDFEDVLQVAKESEEEGPRGKRFHVVDGYMEQHYIAARHALSSHEERAKRRQRRAGRRDDRRAESSGVEGEEACQEEADEWQEEAAQWSRHRPRYGEWWCQQQQDHGWQDETQWSGHEAWYGERWHQPAAQAQDWRWASDDNWSDHRHWEGNSWHHSEWSSCA